MQKGIFYWIWLLLFFACKLHAETIVHEIDLADAIALDDDAKPISHNAKTLTLDDAILLALRENPNVQEAQLNQVMQKFNVHIQEWEFRPHFALSASGTVGESRTANNPLVLQRGVNVEPGASLATRYGTEIELTANNQESKHFNPGLSLQLMQPLLRGFGKPVVEAALNNARDSDVIAKLMVVNVLETTITGIINAYLDVLMAESAIQIDQKALQRALKSVQQTNYYIKAGHMAGNEIVTVKADVANAKTLLEGDKNNLWQARYALLTAIGLDPNSHIQFAHLNIETLIARYQLPSLADAKNAILENDIQYKIDQITLHGPTSRALLLAEDNARWQLNFTGNVNTGNGAGGGQNAGVNSLFNGANQGSSAALTLQIPIDDQLAKEAIVNAKIALKEAELALKQEKWNKETDAINGWNHVVSAKNAVKFAIMAEVLQEKTYSISYQKYLHGLIDSLELQTAQSQLMQAQQLLLNARISYLKALVNLDLLTGNTLKTWDVKVRE